MAHTSLFVVGTTLSFYPLWRIALYLSYKVALRRNGCLEAPKDPHKDPLVGIDYFLRFMNAFQGGYLLSFNKAMFDQHGHTHTVSSFGTKIIRTIDPEVSKAVHATYFPNFGLQGLRYDTATNLCGNGIVVVDGPHRKRGRALIRSSFEVVHLANLERLRKHTDLFLSLLPKDCATVNLAPLFKRLILDTSREFIFGEAMGALKESKECEDFMNAFEYAQRGIGIRSVLGRLKFLHRDKKWWEACQEVTDYADKHVDLALGRLRDEDHKRGSQERSEPPRLVDEMARDTQDRVTLRSHIISVFSPAHDGAATTLTNVVFHLARNPKVWDKLKAEIEPSKDKTLTYALLNSYQYLEWVLKENGLHFLLSDENLCVELTDSPAHGLTTIAMTNQQQCVETTILPFGGGQDGCSPLYV